MHVVYIYIEKVCMIKKSDLVSGQWMLDHRLSPGQNLEKLFLDEYSIHPVKIRKMSFLDALLASTESQKAGFPGRPKTFIREILRKIKFFVPSGTGRCVMVFSTVNQPLDFHGVDLFFYYKGAIVTVDLTLKPARLKSKKHRAHLIFTQDILGSDERMDEFAKQVADLLVDRVNTLPPNVRRKMNKRIWGGAYKVQ